MAGVSSQFLTDEQFRRLSVFIHKEVGINVEAKKVLLEGRLRRRLNQLCIPTFGEYCQYLFSVEGQREELVYMIDAVATNKTDFFREPHQFEYLTQKALPALAAASGILLEALCLERGLLHGRGALYPGHRAQRVCRQAAGV